MPEYRLGSDVAAFVIATQGFATHSRYMVEALLPHLGDQSKVNELFGSVVMHSIFAFMQLVHDGWRSSQRTFRDRHLLHARERRTRFCGRFAESEDMGCRYSIVV
jgi:hypothetical protein